MADLTHKLKKYAAYLRTNPHGEKVVQVLRKLTSLPLTVNLLQETGIGKAVNGFRKFKGDTGVWAQDLIARWKLLVRESVKKHDSSSEDEASQHSASEGNQSADKGSDREDEEEAGSRGDNSRASEAGSDDEGSAREEERDFSDQQHHSTDEDDDRRSEKSSSSRAPSNASSRQRERAGSGEDSGSGSEAPPYQGKDRRGHKPHQHSTHSRSEKHNHHPHQLSGAGHRVKSTGDENHHQKSSSGKDRHREKPGHSDRGHGEGSEKHAGEKHGKHSKERHSGSEKHSRTEKHTSFRSEDHSGDRSEKHSSDRGDKRPSVRGDGKHSKERHSGSEKPSRSEKHASFRGEEHSGDRSEKHSSDRHQKHSSGKPEIHHTDKHSGEKHSSSSINRNEKLSGEKQEKPSGEKHEKHSREKHSGGDRGERHSSDKHAKHSGGGKHHEKHHAGDQHEKVSKGKLHSSGEKSEKHSSDKHDRHSRDKQQTASGDKHEKHSIRKHDQTVGGAHQAHHSATNESPKGNEKQRSKMPLQDKGRSHHSHSEKKDEQNSHNRHAELGQSKSSRHLVTLSDKETEKHSSHSRHSQGEKLSRDGHSRDKSGAKLSDSGVKVKSESQHTSKTKSSHERNKTDSSHQSHHDKSDKTKKPQGDRSLFATFADSKPKSKSQTVDKILGETCDDDYEDYINKWIEDGITQQYNPGSATKTESGANNCMEDYEDLIDQQVDGGCAAEYTPGSVKMSTALRKKARFKDSSQSPDDYGEYIDEGVKKTGVCADYKPSSRKPHKNSGMKVSHRDQSPDDYGEYIDKGVKKTGVCADYKPSSRKPHQNSSMKVSHRDQSPDDYGEWIDQDVKDECTEYRPSHPDKNRLKSRKDASQSPDDYGEFIDRGVKEACVAEYNPSSVKKEKGSKAKEGGGDREQHKSSRHGISSSSSSKTHRTPVDVDIKTRQDGKSFQEPKSRAGEGSSPARSDKAGVKGRDKAKEVQAQKQQSHLPSGSNQANKPSPVKKTLKRPPPVDAKALMEDSLFSAPDDFSIKVPARKRPKLDVSKPSEKQRSSVSADSSSKTHSSSSKEPSSSNAERSPSSQRVSEKSSSKSSDKRREADKGGEDSRLRDSKGSKSSKSGSSSTMRREPSPDGGEGMTSFEDFLNYDQTKAIKKKKVEKSAIGAVSALGAYGLSAPRQPNLTDEDILAALPEANLNINYRPLRLPPIDEDRHRDKNGIVDSMTIASKNTTRTQVYSGRRHGLSEVKSLFDCCVQVLIENIDNIDYVGGIPYDVLKPVVDRATPIQLYNLEDYNPQFLEDTDHLWKAHCQKDFRGCEPDEMETWRELYLRKHDEREAKYLKLKDNMSKTITKGQAGRKVRLAFMDTVAKPPREVRRQQIRHGTAGIVRSDAVRPSSSGANSSSLKYKGYIPMKPQGPAVVSHRPSRPTFHRPAPLMQKTLKMLRKVRH